jgi:hypothetical protein
MDGSGDGSDSGTIGGKMSNRSQKGEGVQRPAGSGYTRQDGNRFHDGTRNNGGGGGQEPPRYPREYGGAVLTAAETEAAAAGAALIADTSKRCHSILSIDLHKERGNYRLLHKMYLMSAYSCVGL